MSMWSTIAYRLKEILQKMIGTRTIEQTLHVAPVISSQMEQAIKDWSDMYKGQASWLKEPTPGNPGRIVSLGLPSLIASEKARTALLEFKSEITTPTEESEVPNPNYQPPQPDEFGNVFPSIQPETIMQDRPISDTSRAEYLEEQYKKLKKKLRQQIEYGIAKGGLVIKPYIVLNKVQNEEGTEEDTPSAQIEFDFIQADSFYPMAFDASGKITEAAFIQTKTEEDTIYRRLEYHKWNGNSVQIINRAYKSRNFNSGDMSGLDLGQEISLSEVSEWKDLQRETTINNVDKPLFAYFKMPEANTIDTTSPLGVSGYSRAVNLIKDADMQYSRLLWEYEGGELAINVDRDAFNWVTDDSRDSGYSALPTMQQRLFRRVDIGEEDMFEAFAPALRDSAYLMGLNTILMRIEDVTGLSRGTISDASAEARTATELKILKQRSYQSNADIQQAIEDALRDVVYIMDVYCDLYEITSEGEYDVSFEWDDSIIVDVDTELGKRITLMQNGLASKIETRMWYFGETERQAQEALQKIDEENRQSMEENLVMQQNLSQERSEGAVPGTEE